MSSVDPVQMTLRDQDAGAGEDREGSRSFRRNMSIHTYIDLCTSDQ